LISKNSKYSPPDLVVYYHKNIPSKVFFRELIKLNCFSILIVNFGYLCIKIQNEGIHLLQNELIVIPSRTSYEILDMSNPLQISLVSFPLTFIFENSIRRPFVGYFEFFITKSPAKISLKSKDAVLLIDLFKLLDDKRRISDVHIFKKELLLFSFNLLLYELAGIYNRYSWQIKVCYTRKETVVMQFFTILEMNCKEQHSVRFYADTLFITTGHLTKTVKEVTDKTTKQFIDEALVLEAKILLQNENLTILHILEELHFKNVSFFSNFFKKHTSMSPSEYRLSLKFH
jgi:AraC-like DNA-binding protein